jgi:hypothetical protein
VTPAQCSRENARDRYEGDERRDARRWGRDTPHGKNRGATAIVRVLPQRERRMDRDECVSALEHFRDRPRHTVLPSGRCLGWRGHPGLAIIQQGNAGQSWPMIRNGLRAASRYLAGQGVKRRGEILCPPRKSGAAEGFSLTLWQDWRIFAGRESVEGLWGRLKECSLCNTFLKTGHLTLWEACSSLRAKSPALSLFPATEGGIPGSPCSVTEPYAAGAKSGNGPGRTGV